MLVTISEPALLFRISKLYRPGMSAQELYDATRGTWKLGTRRNRAKFAFAVFDRIICEVYEIEEWLPAGTSPYPTRSRTEVSIPGRWEFIGRLAPEDMRQRYVGGSVERYFERGVQSPVLYVNIDA